MPSEESVFEPGHVFDQYVIVRLLGQGGMGEVYEVRHEILGTRHALKMILPEMAAQPGVVDRFLREGQAMAGLSHPGIVMVDNFGETDGRYWLRMELMEGRELDGRSLVTLEEYLTAKGGRLPEPEVIAMLGEMLSALVHAQEKGLVHRDLKPANVLFSGTQLKIADFGLVNAAGADWMETQVRHSVVLPNAEDTLIDTSPTGTRSRALMGSYSFMSPEQKKGLAVDHRTDLYSMGLMTFLMLTGHDRPTFRPPSQMVEGISVGWDNWLQRSLEEDPEERFSSANEMLQAFLAFSEPGPDKQVFSSATSHSVSTSVNEPFPVASESSESTMDFTQPQRVNKDGKPKGKLYLALTITCLVVVGLAIYLVNQSSDESSRSAKTSRSKTPLDVATASDVEESALVPKTTWRDLHAEQFANKQVLVAQLARRRKAMIARMTESEGDFFNEQVIDAMSTIPMELFCPVEQIDFVYGDRPVPIGYEESISQPSLTAAMLTFLEVKSGDKVLELKTASGYQTALLAYLGAEVYSLETDLSLGRALSPTLNNLGFDDLHYVVGGNAYEGLPKNGPYDKIIATASYPSTPWALFEQLKLGGRVIAPVGDVSGGQALMLYVKTTDGQMKELELLPVAFSPMPR